MWPMASHNLSGPLFHAFEVGINVITNGYHLQSNSAFRVQSILGLLFYLLPYQVPYFIDVEK